MSENVEIFIYAAYKCKIFELKNNVVLANNGVQELELEVFGDKSDKIFKDLKTAIENNRPITLLVAHNQEFSNNQIVDSNFFFESWMKKAFIADMAVNCGNDRLDFDKFKLKINQQKTIEDNKISFKEIKKPMSEEEKEKKYALLKQKKIIKIKRKSKRLNKKRNR
jgi:hypothetical protein